MSATPVFQDTASTTKAPEEQSYAYLGGNGAPMYPGVLVGYPDLGINLSKLLNADYVRAYMRRWRFCAISLCHQQRHRVSGRTENALWTLFDGHHLHVSRKMEQRYI